MWKLSVFIVSSLFLSAVALPVEKDESSKPIVLEAIDLPAESASVVEIKPTEIAKPTEALIPLVVPIALPLDESKPAAIAEPIADAKPIESTPSVFLESSGISTVSPTVTTLIEALNKPEPTPPRRQVHYDQRQDGKFNIRADLDNFVILVVPSSGTSLLDLLKRSNQKSHHHHHGKHHHAKSNKKYYKKTTTVKTNDKQYFSNEKQTEAAVLPAQPVSGEFIEGRTPYHVDISSAEISQTIPASIAELPLAENPSVVETTVYLPAQIKGNAHARHLQFPPTLAIYPRYRKSLTNDDQAFNTNSVSLTPISNDNVNGNENDNSYYPHAIINGNLNDNGNNGNNGYGMDDDIVKTDQTEILTAPEFYSLNMASNDPLAIVSDTKTTPSDSRLELTLLGAQEQCGPDRRRDSYGVCQFVPQDYATKI